MVLSISGAVHEPEPMADTQNGEYSRPARGFLGFLYLPSNDRAVGVFVLKLFWPESVAVVVKVFVERDFRCITARASSRA
jgi:hypothetical protein